MATTPVSAPAGSGTGVAGPPRPPQAADSAISAATVSAAGRRGLGSSTRLGSGMRIRHDMDRHRFIGETPSGTAVLAYTPAGAGTLDLYSTYVPPGERGRGLGAELVGAAVAFARAQGLRLIPTCWYVAEWLAAHPEHADLLARHPDPGV